MNMKRKKCRSVPSFCFSGLGSRVGSVCQSSSSSTPSRASLVTSCNKLGFTTGDIFEAGTMLTEHRDMLSPTECGALPSVPCPDRSNMVPQFLIPSVSLWDKRGCPSLYRMIQDYARDKHLHKAARHLLQDRNSKEPHLPSDPRQWSREDVAKWIQYITTTHHLPSVHLDRFLMNGKALCLMSMDMFVSRVPLGGKLLYKDFQLRLSRAMYS